MLDPPVGFGVLDELGTRDDLHPKGEQIVDRLVSGEGNHAQQVGMNVGEADELFVQERQLSVHGDLGPQPSILTVQLGFLTVISPA